MQISNVTSSPLKSLVSAEEWQLRTDLAACYRLSALYGWSDLIFTHISAKLPDDGIRQAMAQPQVKEALDMFGMEAEPGTPEELATILRNYSKRWEPVVKSIGFKAD